MDTPFSAAAAAAAEHLLSLFASDLDGARSALEMCCVTQTILRDRVAELEQELNSKQAAMSPPEELRLADCGSDPLLLVCLFLNTKEKVRFRTSSLGLHSTLLGCAIDLIESDEIRKLATVEFVLERFAPFRKFSSRYVGHGTCSCLAARAICGLNVGARLSLSGQYDAKHPETKILESIGFGVSWSVMALSLFQESSAKMLPKLLLAIRPNQVTKLVISDSSAGILTAICEAVESGNLTGLQEISLLYDDEEIGDGDEGLEPDYLGTLGNFGPAFHSLSLRESSQIMDISGLETCKNLRTLELNNTQVVNVSALRSCSNLHTLDLGDTQVADISALSSCSSLHTLDLGNTEVADVSMLGPCRNLHTLSLNSTYVVDVSALRSCSNLHTLYLHSTYVVDVSALGSCSNLHTLYLSWTQVADVSALSSCSSLYMLDLSGTQVTDVSVLGSCGSLHILNIENTAVIYSLAVADLGQVNNLRIER